MRGVHLTEIRSAARSLARSPTVATCAVLCLALGIGATTAISSAISRALLDPLPFRDAGRLVAVHRITPQSGPLGTWPESAPNYVDLAAASKQVEQLAALAFGTALIDLPDGGVQTSQLLVSGNLFGMLGARAQAGRYIQPADDRADSPPVAVLGDDIWRTRFGADPGVVGRSLVINGRPTTVIGIAPPDFRIPHGGNVMRADVWTPIGFTPQQLTARRSNYLKMLGRLAPGATVQSADAEMRGLFANLVAAWPQLNGENLRVAPLFAENVKSVRQPLLLLFGAVCMVLLIAATNVAALLLARGVQKQREFAVRAALGASRWDTLRPALIESFLLTGVSVLAGLALAGAGVKTIGLWAAERMPQLRGLHLDGRVLGFAIVLAVVVALVCGAAPAWRGTAVDPQDALRSGRGGGTGKQHHRALRGLVILEISLSLVLVIGAGLVLKGFARLLSADPGFDPRHILTLQVTTSAARYQDQSALTRFLQPALDGIGAIPGVDAAGSISAIPYLNWGINSNIRYEGQSGADPTRLPLAEQRAVTPEFFAVTRQRLLAGRLLRPTDDARPEAPLVVVVNEALVRRDFPNREPVGQRFYRDNFPGDTVLLTIVGVVSDIRNVGPFSAPQPEMYSSYEQGFSGATGFSLMIRVRDGDPMVAAPAVRAAIRRIDPTAAVADVATMPDVIARSLGRPRFYFALLGTFAAIAMILAVAGLYGVLSYAVAQRIREIGIRAALGSPRRAIVRLVATEGLRLVVAGVVLGLAGGAALTRLMVFMLYGVSPLDAATWMIAAGILAVAAMAAALVPALRAARVHPLVAIQAE